MKLNLESFWGKQWFGLISSNKLNQIIRPSVHINKGEGCFLVLIKQALESNLITFILFYWIHFHFFYLGECGIGLIGTKAWRRKIIVKVEILSLVQVNSIQFSTSQLKRVSKTYRILNQKRDSPKSWPFYDHFWPFFCQLPYFLK